MSQEPQTQAIAQFKELPAIAASAGEVLVKNQSWRNGAITKAQYYLDNIDGFNGEGIPPEMYKEIIDFLIKVGIFKGKMNDARSPLTQLFTAIAREFTTLENDMDKAKDGTVMFKLQKALNEEVRRQEIIKRQKEEEIKREAMAKQERIELTAKIEGIVRQKYLDTLLPFKNRASAIFNGITLETAAETEKAIRALPDSFPRDKFTLIEVSVYSQFIPKDELSGLVYDTKMSLYPELSANFKEVMAETKMLTIDQIPARIAELKEISAAGAKEKKRLQEQAELRRKEQEIREREEAVEAKRKQDEAAELNQSISQAELSFSTDVAQAEIHQETDMKSKAGYVIKVMTAAGWNQVVTFWFGHFGKDMPFDKFEKKTLASMKGDLEKLALSTDGKERISDSGHLIYELDYKAVIKK